ncbi:hypothetical protein KCU85_g3128, partial [Aureobasidium melanogenum]
MAEPMDISSPDLSRKRSLPDDDQTSVSKSESQVPTPPLTASPANKDSIRQASPAPSSSALSSAPSGTNDQPADPNAPPKKRRKYTSAEKEERRLEKEKKDKEKAELKLKRDEEKQKKDEEKRRKNEEKEAKQREKDLKKAREEEEKQKKARAQPKIASFFKTPSLNKSPAASTPVQPSPAKENTTSSEPVDTDVPMTSPTPKKSPQQSDYRKTFLPFQLKAHTKCAPYVPALSSNELQVSQEEMDKVLQHITTKASPTSCLKALFAEERVRSRGLWQPTAREVIESIQGSSQVPIDLTDESGEHYRPADLLNSLTVRHLHFGEDVRPAYYGTYSRKISSANAAKLRKNPFSKLREDTNYDDDSEAEWEEPEEGEDIGSDGEEDEESVGDAEEMDEFLEDDAADSKRHMITGDLKPVSTGLCWEDVKGVFKSSTEESPVDLDSMKIDFFIPLTKPSINPFSTSYWQAPSLPAVVAAKTSGGQMQLDGKMKPPKTPLMPRSNTNDTMTIIGASSGMKGPIMSVASTKAAKPAPKPLQGPELAEFKDAVDGSNLTKVDLLKALKKRFPKHTNDTIKATLSVGFARVGQHEADKVWKAVAA